ncbi:MAG TPA: lipid-A-disaccharide synthase [Planctomycetaceae bacterium]|nr:lipid-A-disaccharide synthase [Planctomycetaceae bacterium]
MIKNLREVRPGTRFRGFGGERMQAAGCQLDYELTQLAVVGFVEVAPKLREFFRVADVASDVFDKRPPSAVVLVDFPGFNWHIAKRAKQRGIPVFYYLPPQLWAWGSWRVKKLKRYVDHVFCNLPFEADWYAERNVSSEYVGHPFFDEVADQELDSRFVSSQRQRSGGLRVAVLPGSRSREVNHIWPMQLEIIRELARRHPTAKFSVACLRANHKEYCQRLLCEADRRLPIEFHVGKTSEIAEAADCALMKSGSTSLEMMARGTPTVVVYHVGRLMYSIAKTLTDIKEFSLPNIIAGKTIMPEFLAVGSTTQAVEQATAAMDRLLSDRDERDAQRRQLQKVYQSVGGTGASRRTALRINALLDGEANQDDANLARAA